MFIRFVMSFHLGGQPMVFGHAPAFHVGNGPWHPPQQYHSAYSQGPAVVNPAAMPAPNITPEARPALAGPSISGTLLGLERSRQTGAGASA